jgi:Skp family chaperone for outer membrane proteins
MRYSYSFTRRKLQRFFHVGWIGISLAIAAICLTVGRGQEVQRQAPPASEAATKSAVAIIDVQHIFNEHKAFQRRRRDLDAEVAASEADVRRKKDAVEQLKAQRAKLVEGSPEWDKLDNDLVRQQVELQAKIQQERKRFLQQEYGNFIALYDEIMREVDAYIADKPIELVLRSSEGVQEILDANHECCSIAFPQRMRRPVVAFKKHIDITQEILKRLNAKEHGRAAHQPEKTPIER